MLVTGRYAPLRPYQPRLNPYSRGGTSTALRQPRRIGICRGMHIYLGCQNDAIHLYIHRQPIPHAPYGSLRPVTPLATNQGCTLTMAAIALN